jgi:hypothetical protein
VDSADETPGTRSADERQAYDQLDFFYQHGPGYAVEMKNRPRTLYGIEDSPVGFAAWMLDSNNHQSKQPALKSK